jgi:tetratricopeptide (TPR) repeat protein
MNYQSEIWLPPDYGIEEIYEENGVNESGLVDTGDVEQTKDGEAENFFTRGLWKTKVGEHLSAVDEFSSSILIDSSIAKYFTKRGDSQKILGNFQSAIDDYGEALSLTPNLPEALVGRGQAYSEIGELARSINDYTLASYLRPDWRSISQGLGYSYNRTGDHTASILEYQKCIKPRYINQVRREPTADAPFRLQQNDRFNQLIEKIQSNKIDSEANFYIGLNRLAGSKYKEAVEDLSRSIGLNQYNADALFNRGLALEALNQHNDALDDLETALSLDPSYAPLVSTLGGKYITLAEEHIDTEGSMTVRISGSIKSMTAIISLDLSHKQKKTIDALYSRGILYLENADLDMAFADLEAIPSLKNRGSANVFHALGIVCAKTGRAMQSIKAFAEAIRLDERYRYLLFREDCYHRLTCSERLDANSYFNKHTQSSTSHEILTDSLESETTHPIDSGAVLFSAIDPSNGSGDSEDEDLSDVWLTDQVNDVYLR